MSCRGVLLAGNENHLHRGDHLEALYILTFTEIDGFFFFTRGRIIRLDELE